MSSDTGKPSASPTDRLRSELGEPLDAADLAEILGIDPRTVKRYADRWGGVEVAPGTYRFFENRVREILNSQPDAPAWPARTPRPSGGGTSGRGQVAPSKSPSKEEDRAHLDRHGLLTPPKPRKRKDPK